MPHNTLFHFIKTHKHETTTVLDARARIVEAVDRKGASYFRFELPTEGALALHEGKHTYSLRDHHISVYETEHSRIAELSQYHYTARYLDKADRMYQLHVYFNADEEVVKEPVFSQIISGAGGSDIVPAPAEALNGFFISAAITHSKAIVGSIRQKLNLTIDEYAAIYKRLELEAFELSKSMKTDLEGYRHKLQEMSALLQRLVPLVAHSHYASTHLFLQKMIVAIGKQAAIISTEGAAGAGAPEETEVITAIDRPGLGASTCETSKKIIEPIVLDERIHELARVYVSINKKDPSLLTRVISNTLREINELFLDESNVTISISALEALHKLHREVQQDGEALFEALLLSGNTSVLNELSAFYHLINEKHLAFALQTANVNLLDFILTYGNFSINEQTVSVGDVTYPTAVHFCYERNSEATPLTDCLTVLLKHKASIILCDTRGLPMAYSILSMEHHPLQRALDVSGLLDSVFFYKRLVSELEVYLKDTRLAAKERKKIEHQINVHNRNINTLNSIARDEGFRTKAKAVCLPETLSAICEAVLKDPIVTEANAALELAYNRYLASATEAQIRGSVRDSKANIDAQVGFLNAIDPRLWVFEIVRILMITRIQTTTELFQAHTRLNELTKPKARREARTCSPEEKEIRKKIKKLEKDLVVPSEPLEDDSKKTPETLGKGLEKVGLFAATLASTTTAASSSTLGAAGAGGP